MAFTLEVVFVGLVAFVPEPAGTPTKITALLLDATKPYVASDGRTIPSHKPLILYCCDNLPGGKCTKDDWDLGAMAYFYATLHGLRPAVPGTQTVSCKGYGARALDGMTIDVNLKNVDDQALKIDPSFIADVAYIPEFNPGALAKMAKVDPKFLQSPPTAPYDRLLAASSVFTKTKDVKVTSRLHSPAEYRFATMHDPTEIVGQKKIAEATAFYFTVNTSTINEAEIDLTSFRSSSKVALNLAPVTGQSIVPVFVVNIGECPRWLPGTAGTWYCEDSVPPDFDRGNHHFEVYYELTNSRPPQRHRPVPFCAASCAPPKATPADWNMFYLSNRPMCPPARLAP